TPDDSDDAPSDGGADESSNDNRDSEEGSSDASDDAPSAVAGAAGASPKTGKPKGAKARSKDGMTAGARLAAAKAAKAARKAAKRGKEKKEQDPVAQMRESELAKKAQEAGSWAAENRSIVLAAAVLLVVAVGAWIGWTQYSQSQAQAAGALLRDAIEIAQAEIVPEAEGDDAAESDAPTFPTEQARAEAALEAYRRVLTEYGGSDAAVWARLGEADALATLDRHE